MTRIAWLVPIFAMGCFSVEVDEPDQFTRFATIVGPDHDADVQLADAVIWTVPHLQQHDTDVPEAVTWTLLHPNRFIVSATIRRTCFGGIEEPFLWLSDPPNWSDGSALATFKECKGMTDSYSTVELAFDGYQWVGISATGNATLLPPQ